MTQEPRYRRIAEELRHSITEHAYGPGGKLPSEGALAEQFEVSRGTIRQALMLLRQDGLVTSRRGTRRVVLDDAPVQDFAQMQSFARWARSIGETPEGRVVRQGWHPADPDEQRHMRIDASAPGAAGGASQAAVRTPGDAGAHGLPRAGGRDRGESGHGHGVRHRVPGARRRSSSRTPSTPSTWCEPTPRTPSCWAAPPGDPLLRERRRSTDPAGVPLEWSEDRYVPGSVAFVVHNSLASTPMTRQHMVPGNSGS